MKMERFFSDLCVMNGYRRIFLSAQVLPTLVSSTGDKKINYRSHCYKVLKDKDRPLKMQEQREEQIHPLTSLLVAKIRVNWHRKQLKQRQKKSNTEKLKDPNVVKEFQNRFGVLQHLDGNKEDINNTWEQPKDVVI